MKYRIFENGRKYSLENLGEDRMFTIYCRENCIYIPINGIDVDKQHVDGKNEIKYSMELPSHQEIIFELQE